MKSYFTIEAADFDGVPMIKLAIGTDTRGFTASLPVRELRTPQGQEMIRAWATSMAFIPGADIPIRTIEEFLDVLEARFPVPHNGLRRPLFRLW